jgi:hypothetical protein
MQFPKPNPVLTDRNIQQRRYSRTKRPPGAFTQTPQFNHIVSVSVQVNQKTHVTNAPINGVSGSKEPKAVRRRMNTKDFFVMRRFRALCLTKAVF